MLQGSAIPNVDSSLWWIPTNHTTSALNCNTPCLALETSWASSVVQWCQWGPIFLSFKPCILYLCIDMLAVTEKQFQGYFKDLCQTLMASWRKSTRQQRQQSLTPSYHVSTRHGSLLVQHDHSPCVPRPPFEALLVHFGGYVDQRSVSVWYSGLILIPCFCIGPRVRDLQPPCYCYVWSFIH